MISYINYETKHNVKRIKTLNILKDKFQKNTNPQDIFKINKIQSTEFNLMLDLNNEMFNRHVSLENSQYNNDDIESCCDPSLTYNIVYQYKYKNKPVTGFGDFIRGIYFILQFSEKYNINFDFNINNHIIKKYLHYFCDKPTIPEDISVDIPFFDVCNYKYVSKNNIIDYEVINKDNMFFKFLFNLTNYDNHKYLYTNNHPNKQLIDNKQRVAVQNIIKPTDYIYNLTESALANLKLTKHQFITVHIRTNDACFSNKQSLDFKKNLRILFDFIQKIYLNHKLDILVLSSDNNVKLNIVKFFPNVKMFIHNITHTCTNNNDEKGIINTLKDFYIMSYSKYIYSFSVYDHGSGFSKWCATTYNIPYVCYSLQ
jgi:hypothetical protein